MLAQFGTLLTTKMYPYLFGTTPSFCNIISINEYDDGKYSETQTTVSTAFILSCVCIPKCKDSPAMILLPICFGKLAGWNLS